MHFTAYDHHHIVTEEHSIVFANGLPSESYLDTGHRRPFDSQSALVTLPARAASWEEDAAAPLDTSRDFVEREFDLLAERARSLGLSDDRTAPHLTNDPALRLVTPSGKILGPLGFDGRHATFMLPPGISEVRIVSRTARPSDTIGPFVDDRRHLGVLVGAVTLLEAGEEKHIDAHLSGAPLHGWDVMEAASCRWTNGNATLPVGERLERYFGKLTVELVAAGPYIDDAKKTVDQAASYASR